MATRRQPRPEGHAQTLTVEVLQEKAPIIAEYGRLNDQGSRNRRRFNFRESYPSDCVRTSRR
jgi:hypothetical protein